MKKNRVANDLYDVIHSFKTMVIYEYIKKVKSGECKAFVGKVWHKNYYEHIVRNRESYKRIANYIKNNPKKWNLPIQKIKDVVVRR